MPVENAGPAFPVADVQFEHAEGPIVVEVESDHNTSTGYHEVEIGDEQVDESAIHSQEPTNAYPNPEPYTVSLDGFSTSPKKAKTQTKVVKAPKDAPAEGTSGAEKK